MAKDFAYDGSKDKCLWEIDVITYKDRGVNIRLMSYDGGPKKLAFADFWPDKTGKKCFKNWPNRIRLDNWSQLNAAIEKACGTPVDDGIQL